MARITKFTMLAMLGCFLGSAWPAQAKPLPEDSRIKTGKLSNGLTWMYRKHDNPPGKMAFNLHVRSGSLNETDAQQGLAHFMEHMCFNGTDHFAPGELIPYFESIGMQFGRHLNAFTSFDQTVYMLFTPDTEVPQVDKALMVLSDYAFRCLLLPEEIDKERGVVLEESRRGKGAAQRLRKKVWPQLFAGTRFAERLPIGKDEIIESAPPSEVIDYYRTWYRPENMTLVLVGDADPEPFLPSIEKWFGKYTATVPARKQERPGFIPFTQQRAIVESDPEMSRCDIQMLNIKAGRPPTLTEKQARVDLVESLGGWIVGRRFEERINKGQASYLRAGASTMNFFNDGLLVFGSASGKPEKWEKMLEEMVMEVNRAREFGFTSREFDLAKSELTAGAERAVKTEPTRNARSIVGGIARNVNDREPNMSAQQDLDVLHKLLPTIDIQEVSKVFKQHFAPGNFAYVVEMPEKDDVSIPTKDDVLATARAAWARKVEPILEDDAPTTLLATLPNPTKIVAQATDKTLGITDAWLENGVRVHHRFMDYKKDSVRVTISLAGGQIEETADNAGITQVAALAVNDAATSRLTSTNIRDIMTGKNINVRAFAGGDVFTLSVSGSPTDLEIGLQEAYALLTDGKIEQSAFDNWKQSTLQQLDMMDKMPSFKASEALADLISGGDPRQTLISRKKVEAQSVAGAQEWFDRLCATAPIEVAVVGDMTLEDAMPLIQKYVGSLPKRNRNAAHLDKLRKLARPTGPLASHIKVETMTPQAMSFAGFMGCEGRQTNERRALSIASNILTSRVIKKIREDLSIVYSIRAGSRPSWVYKDSGMFIAGAPCSPENVDQVADEVHAIFKSFATDGPTDEELANAKKQIAERLDTDMLEPSFWMGLLRNHDLHGRDYTEAKGVKDAYQRFTAAQVQGVFKKYYVPTRQFRVTAVPSPADASGDPGSKKEKAPAS